VTNYAWIDDHQLLWAMPNSAHLSRIDLRAHDQRLITEVNAYADAKTWARVDVGSVARGGKRALSAIKSRSDQDIAGVVARPSLIDLEGRFTRELDSGESPVWMPDGRRWLALDTEERYRNESNPKPEAWLFSIDAPHQKAGPIAIPAQVKSLVGVTPDERLVMTDLPAGIDEPAVTVWQQGIYLNPAPPTQGRLNAPHGWFYREAALSPKADRIAWVLTTSSVPRPLAFLHRILPGVFRNVAPTRTFELATSRLDGKDIRSLGFQDGGKDNAGVITNLKWNPDGRRLSFVYRGNLYILPANH
jgi:hypothetical protein